MRLTKKKTVKNKDKIISKRKMLVYTLIISFFHRTIITFVEFAVIFVAQSSKYSKYIEFVHFIFLQLFGITANMQS